MSDKQFRGPELGRRDVVKTTLGASVFGVAGAGSSAAASQTFTVEQGGTTHAVEPIRYEGQTIEEFYGYREEYDPTAETPTHFEESDATQLFLYEGPNGISLVLLHDKPYDGSDGRITYEFSSLPSEGEWVVPDDPGDNYSRTRAEWSWAPHYSDGGAYRGGIDQSLNLTLSVSGYENIDTLLVRRSNGEPVELDLTQPVTLSGGGSTTPSDDLDALVDQKLSLASHIDDASLGYVDDTGMVEPVVANIRDALDAGDIDEATAKDAVKRLFAGEKITDVVLAGSGPASSAYLAEETNVAKLTSKNAVNPVIEILFAGISLVKFAKLVPGVGGHADRVARGLADAVADAAGRVDETLERIIRQKGEDAGFSLLSAAEAGAKKQGKPIAESEFKEHRDEQSALLLEDSSETLFRTFLFSEEYDWQGNPTTPLDQSVERLVDAADPETGGGVTMQGETSDALEVSQRRIDDLNDDFQDLDHVLSESLVASFLENLGVIEVLLAVAGALVSVVTPWTILGGVLSAAAALAGLGGGLLLTAMQWGNGAGGILATRYQHQLAIQNIIDPT